MATHGIPHRSPPAAGMAQRPAAAPRPGTFGRVRRLYRETIVRDGRSEGFLISLSFVLGSLVVRGITHLIYHQKLQFLLHNISSGSGTHIHHMVFGILGLLVAGFIAIGYRPERLGARRALAIAFGAAAALTLDEFALWLRLEDVYWSPQGRESVAALILAGGVSLLGIEGFSFWRALWRDTIWLLFKGERPYPPL